MLNPIIGQSFSEINNKKLDWMVLFHRLLFWISIAVMCALCVPLLWPFLSQTVVIGLFVCAAASLVALKVIEWKAGSVLLVFDAEMGGVERSPTLVKQWVEAMDARIGDNLKENQIAIRFRVFGGLPIIYGQAGYVWAFQNLCNMRWKPPHLVVECTFGKKETEKYTEELGITVLTDIIRDAHEEILVPLVAYRGGSGVTDKLRDLLSGKIAVYQIGLRTYYAQANKHVRELLAKNAITVAEETTKNERLIALELYVTLLDCMESHYCKYRNTSRFGQTLESVDFAGVLLSDLQTAYQGLEDVRAGLSPEVKRIINIHLNNLREKRQDPPTLLYLDVEKEKLRLLRVDLSKEKKKP